MNSTWSVGFLKWPLICILDYNNDINSLSLARPSPVTLLIVKIGVTLSEAKEFAKTLISSSSLTITGILPHPGDFNIFTNVSLVYSYTFYGAISILVMTMKMGTFKAREIPKCSLVILLTPMFAPTIIIL